MASSKQFYLILWIAISTCLLPDQSAFGLNRNADKKALLSPKLILQNQLIKKTLLSYSDKKDFLSNLSKKNAGIFLETQIVNGNSRANLANIKKLLALIEDPGSASFNQTIVLLVKYSAAADRAARRAALPWIFSLAVKYPDHTIALLEKIMRENHNSTLHYYAERVLQTLSMNRIRKTETIRFHANDLIYSAI